MNARSRRASAHRNRVENASRLTILSALATLSLFTARAAAAVPTQPMTFTLVRGDDPACTPDCPQWIAAEGEIKPGTSRVFADFLARVAGRPPVVVLSNGGSVDDALAMGRLIRARKLAVAVGRTTLFPVPPGAKPSVGPPTAYAVSYPAYCVSACPLVLAGGVERYAHPIAYVGMHEIRQDISQVYVLRRYRVYYQMVNGQRREISREVLSENRRTVASTRIGPPAINARVASYLKEMGEDAKLVDIMGTATPEQMHRLSADEEKDTRLITVWIDRSEVMRQAPPDSGLAGMTVDGANATLDAQARWPLDPDRQGRARDFVAQFAMRRGGAGVAATFRLPDHFSEPLRYGIEPSAPGLWRRFLDDAREMTVFLPAATFCRQARVGDVIVLDAEPPPTQAPGAPDAHAPLLLQPLATIAGLATLTSEICVAGAR